MSEGCGFGFQGNGPLKYMELLFLKSILNRYTWRENNQSRKFVTIFRKN